MKRLISVLFICCLLFCGCSKKEEFVPYDLAICDVAMAEISEYISSFDNENFSVMETEFSSAHVDVIISALKTSSNGLKSITLYSENISTETAEKFISLVKMTNIPVIFAFSDIPTETLESYDKAFCIVTDYIHAGEITAENIKHLWTNGTITDKNDDKIFTFSVVKEETSSPDYEAFYSTVINRIELYGVPMQVKSIVTPEEIAGIEALDALKADSEGVIIISDKTSDLLHEYSTENENIEFITIQQNTASHFSESGYILTCFIDYKNYKFAVDEILRNYNNRQYPLIDMSFYVENRTVFIPATI